MAAKFPLAILTSVVFFFFLVQSSVYGAPVITQERRVLPVGQETSLSDLFSIDPNDAFQVYVAILEPQRFGPGMTIGGGELHPRGLPDILGLGDAQYFSVKNGRFSGTNKIFNLPPFSPLSLGTLESNIPFVESPLTGTVASRNKVNGEPGPLYFQDLFIPFTTYDFFDVIDKSVSLSISDSGLLAVFDPKFDLSLADAATVGGYESFGWMQWVVKDTLLEKCRTGEASGKACDDLNFTLTGELPSLPYIDPPLGGFQYHADEGIFIDTFPLYDNLGQESVFDDKLIFLDLPINPAGEEIVFRTALAGVKENHEIDLLLAPTTAWQWTHTTLEDSQVEGDVRAARGPGNPDPGPGFLSTIEISPLNPLTDFTPQEEALFADLGFGFVGLNDAVTRNIPEPGSLTLFGLGLLGLGLAVRRRR